jgi:energy-coupling factor transporter ATP-binding protein EcfA2
MRDEKDFRPVRQRIGLLFQDADDQLFSHWRTWPLGP